MDLDIAGRKAIVCASSKGLGRACAMSLAREGVAVTVNARTAKTLEQTAEDIRRDSGAEVTAVACDVTTPEGQATLLEACPEPDILVNNAGGPPPGDFRDWSREDWMKAVAANMLTPIELIKATVDGMIARRFGRIVNITSASTKSPIPDLGMSNGARTGLAGFVAGLARQTVRHNVTINCLLPGRFVTDRMRQHIAHSAAQAGQDYDSFAAALAEQTPAGRFGRPEEFGDACALLCSAQMGYVTGQHFLMDGGDYRGTF
jgi:3-oxoacyl-[acyl-carrier protein] reductase